MKKRVVSFVMMVCVAVMFFVSCSVTAFASSPGEIGGQFVKLKYVLTQLGCLFGGDLDEMISNSDKFKQFSDDKIPTVEDGKGNVTIDNSVVNNIYNVANEELSKQNGYYLLTPVYDLDQVFSTITDVKYSTFLRAQQELKVNYSSAFINNLKSVQFFAPQKQGKIYFYISGNVVFMADEEFDNVPFQRYKFDDNSDVGMTIFTGSYQNYWQWSSFQTQYAGYTTKVFYSFQDLKNYVINGGNFYTTSNFNNFNIYADNSLTINSNTLNNTNWSQTNNNIYQNIYNEYPNVAPDKKQDLIDKKYDDIIGELGDIGGSIDDLKDSMTRWLKRIYEKVDAILSAIKGFNPSELPKKMLDNISDMAIFLDSLNTQFLSFMSEYANFGAKFDKLLDSVLKFPEFISGKIDELIKAIEGIEVNVENTSGGFLDKALSIIVGGFLDILVGGARANISAAVSELSTTFEPIVDVSKTRFPFSIPWDLQRVVELVSAPPEVPKFSIPFKVPNMGLDYSLDIDLKDWESMAKISRAFFTIMFVIALMGITTKFIGKGAE